MQFNVYPFGLPYPKLNNQDIHRTNTMKAQPADYAFIAIKENVYSKLQLYAIAINYIIYHGLKDVSTLYHELQLYPIIYRLLLFAL